MVLALSKIKGIIFDLGYTLIEYRNRPWSEVNREAKKSAYAGLLNLENRLPDFESFDHRFETVKEEYRSAAFANMKGWVINDVIADILKEYKIENAAERADYFTDEFYKFGRAMIVVSPDTVATLKHIKELGYRTGAISNTIYPACLHETDLESYGLISYLDFRIYSSEFGLRKPHPEIFKAGIERIGLSPSEVAYVGDRLDTDALGAQMVGLHPIVKLCEKENYPDPMPDDISVVSSISDLPRLLMGAPGNHQISKYAN